MQTVSLSLPRSIWNLSFVDVDDVIDVNERLLAELFKEDLDVDVQLPIQRMTWQEAMDRFGSDKPDTAFWYGTTGCNRSCERLRIWCIYRMLLETGGSVRGINARRTGTHAS